MIVYINRNEKKKGQNYYCKMKEGSWCCGLLWVGENKQLECFSVRFGQWEETVTDKIFHDWFSIDALLKCKTCPFKTPTVTHWESKG